MPAPSWPPTLPKQFIRGTYQEQFGENRLISQMESGPAKIRRRTSAAPAKITGQMYLSFTELAILREFYFNILKHGSLLFYMPYPPGSATGVTDAFLRFATPPSWQRVADQALVSLELEMVP